MMRASATVAILMGSLYALSCGASPQPIAPSAASGATPPSPAPTVFLSNAALAISGFTATAVSTPNNGSYRVGYRLRFMLAETGGRSGATILDVETAVEDRFSTGPGCWRDTVRVEPGGTLDLFNTDSGYTWLGYCSPDPASRTVAAQVSLVVTYKDDEGGIDLVQAWATVTR